MKCSRQTFGSYGARLRPSVVWRWSRWDWQVYNCSMAANDVRVKKLAIP